MLAGVVCGVCCAGCWDCCAETAAAANRKAVTKAPGAKTLRPVNQCLIAHLRLRIHPLRSISLDATILNLDSKSSNFRQMSLLFSMPRKRRRKALAVPGSIRRIVWIATGSKNIPQGLKPGVFLLPLEAGDKSPAYQPCSFKTFDIEDSSGTA